MMRSAATCSACEVHAESTFRVEGMDCHEEVALLEKRLAHLDGVHAFSADVIGQRMRVAHDAARVPASVIAEAVAETGMRAWLEQETSLRHRAPSARRRLALVGASGVLLALAGGVHLAGTHQSLEVAACAGAIVLGGVYTARRAVAAAKHLSLDINFLMTIAVAGAIVLGEWFEAASVVFLFALAQWLEARSLDRARHAIGALMDLAPAEVTVRREGVERRRPAEDVAVGDLVVVRPGEKVALDGEVISGTSDVNQAPVTGEAVPVSKEPGDGVFAGSINGHGALEVRVTRLGSDSTIARIIHLVERAQAQRAPSQALVDRFAHYYTPAVIALAIGVALVPPLAGYGALGDWFYRALVLLVISCPCALVISTPVSIVSALAAAAHHGVLVKGGVHLERTADVRCVAFDKTGTLTTGRLEVEDVVPLGAYTRHHVLASAASIEARSEHPIGRAIVRRATRDGWSLEPAQGFRALPGRGAEAFIRGSRCLLGNHRLFEERGLCSEHLHGALESLAEQGRTTVMLASGGVPVGVIGVADRPREGAAETIAELRRLGVRHIVLLSGDSTATARSVARAVGADEVRAELLPEDKVTCVADLRRRYGAVAMVGDGVNDAPALAAADVGIAMGAAGTHAALETADVALMSDDLRKVPFAIRLGHRTMANIRTNIAIALGLKGLFLIMAIAGSATLWMAVLADMGASLLVVANGLRLLGTRDRD